MKLCPKCKTITDNFGFNKLLKGGLACYCRPCSRTQSKEAHKKGITPVVHSCATCQWQYAGKCSVVDPGTAQDVSDDDVCGKWERIRKEYSDGFSSENYENSYTKGVEGASIVFEGYFNF